MVSAKRTQARSKKPKTESISIFCPECAYRETRIVPPGVTKEQLVARHVCSACGFFYRKPSRSAFGPWINPLDLRFWVDPEDGSIPDDRLTIRTA